MVLKKSCFKVLNRFMIKKSKFIFCNIKLKLRYRSFKVKIANLNKNLKIQSQMLIYGIKNIMNCNKFNREPCNLKYLSKLFKI